MAARGQSLEGLAFEGSRRQPMSSSKTTSAAPTEMEQDVVDDMAVNGAVDQIAQRAADDQGKAGAGNDMGRWRAGGQIEHESDDQHGDDH